MEKTATIAYNNHRSLIEKLKRGVNISNVPADIFENKLKKLSECASAVVDENSNSIDNF